MTDALLANVGKIIRALRKEKNVSIEELAFAADISYVYLSQVEHGQGNLTIKVLYQIAAALGVTPASLLPENPRINVSRDEAKILETLKQLTAQIKEQQRYWG